jgi:hypothetical protein
MVFNPHGIYHHRREAKSGKAGKGGEGGSKGLTHSYHLKSSGSMLGEIADGIWDYNKPRNE